MVWQSCWFKCYHRIYTPITYNRADWNHTPSHNHTRHKKELEVIRGRSKQHIFQVIRGQLKVSGFPLRLSCSPLTGRIIHLAAVCPACDRKTRAKSPSVTGITMRYHYMNNSFIITLSDRHINLHRGQSDSLMVSVVVLQIKVIASYRVIIAL